MPDTADLGSRTGEHSSSEHVARSAGIASAAVFVSRITGLLREIALARSFGAGESYDAFLLGFRIPNLTRDLFAEGALSSAFVPVFVEKMQKEGRHEAARLANLVATAILLVVGAVCVLGVIFAPLLVDRLASGFHEVPGKFDLAVRMTRVMFPFLLLVALAAQAMGILNACNKFGLPALSSAVFNVGSLVVGLSIGFLVGPYIGLAPIEGMAWGVVIGGALQLFVQVPTLIKEGFTFRPAIDWRDPALLRILAMMGPAILGNAAVQINVAVNSNFASHILDPVRGYNGAISWLGYAFRFMQLPLGLFGVAIGNATLPAISRSAGMGDIDGFRRTVSRSLGLILLLTVPSAAGLMVLGRSIIGAIFEWGHFKTYDTDQTAIALACFSIGLTGYSMLKVIVPAFYALKDSRTPMYVSLGSIAINYLLVTLLTSYTDLGHAGLALSTSCVATSGAVVLFLVLRNRIGGVYGRELFGTVWRVLIAAALMSASAGACSWVLRQSLPPGKAAYFFDIALSMPVAIAVYYFACRALRIEALDLAVKAIARPLERLRARIP